MRAVQIISQILKDQLSVLSKEGGLGGRIDALSRVIEALGGTRNFVSDTPWYGKTSDGKPTGLLAHLAYRNSIAQSQRRSVYLSKLAELPGLLSRLTINMLLPESADNNFGQSLDTLLSYTPLPVKAHRVLKYASGLQDAKPWFRNKLAFPVQNWRESLGEFTYIPGDVQQAILYYQTLRDIIRGSAFGGKVVQIIEATPLPPTPTQTSTATPAVPSKDVIDQTKEKRAGSSQFDQATSSNLPSRRCIGCSSVTDRKDNHQ